MYGTYENTDERPILHFERHLHHPVDAVWRAITEPAQLSGWFPTQVELDLRVGGKMRFVFPDVVALPPMDGEVIELDPPHRLVFTWGDDELSFELEPGSTGDDCVLRFAVVLDADDKAARDAAGWHQCLDHLEEILAGERSARPFPPEGWRGLYDEYAHRGLPTGAEIPT